MSSESPATMPRVNEPVPHDERPVGVLDSGVGGLTTLHECLVSLPHEDFAYLGDTARFPYGSRSAEELEQFACQLTDVLLAQGAKLIVVACNSAAAAALPALRRKLDGVVPLVAVIEPEARLAAGATQSGDVGLIATPATVASGAYERAVAAASNGEVRLHSVASADLASVIQEGGEIDERTVDCVERACEPLLGGVVDTVILGCTHYPLVRPLLQRTLGRGVRIITSGEAIAEAVESELMAEGAAAPRSRRGGYRFLSTGEPEEFRQLGTRFLQLPIARVNQVRLSRDPEEAIA